MKVLLVGATGTIGGPVGEALADRGHDVVRAGRSGGDVRVDIESSASILSAYESVGAVDAVVCTAGAAAFGSLETLDDEGFALSFRSKVMGQVNLVRHGLGRVVEGGSFTLTTGTLSVEPTPDVSAVALAGGAVESFARAAALDLSGRYRLNVVSPGWVAESRVAMGLEPMPGIWARELSAYYVACVEGDATGEILMAEGPLER